LRDPSEAIESGTVFSPSPSWWEGGGHGPFKVHDIEWLSMPTADFQAIRSELPKNLQLVERDQETAIMGYEME
jgi:hypothetical protein